jgi:hypothetical protein
MEINLSMGTYCPKCNITIGTYSVVGGKTNCPQCHGEMIAAPIESQVRIISNFKCECGVQIGHLSVVGAKATCPGCKKEI